MTRKSELILEETAVSAPFGEAACEDEFHLQQCSNCNALYMWGAQ